MLNFDDLSNIPKEHKEYFLRYIKTAPQSFLKELEFEKMKPDTIFIRENEEVDYIYILLDGSVRAVDYRVHGISYEFMRFHPVKMLGAMEIILNIKNYCTTLITETTCTMLVCSAKEFSKWILNDLNAIKMEAEMVGKFLLEQDRKNRLFLFLQGRDRLFVLFIQHYEKYSKNGKCIVKLTRVELSDRTGISVRTINRSIKKMQEEGFIGKENSKIAINEEQYQKMIKFINEKID